MTSSICIQDLAYPKLLKTTKGAPKCLYYRGNFNENIFDNCLAIVGSRHMSPYGKRVVEKFMMELSPDITVVSGFMYGVDAWAHEKALDNGKRTIAVMPCGVDLVHPSYQKDLYEKILNNNGLILSEFDGSYNPHVWSYPKRNRIVAGVSKVVLVVEAAINSGSLITASFAKEFKRKVFSVPGNIFSSLSEGCLQLIKESASVVTSGYEINQYFGLGIEGKKAVERSVTMTNDEILRLLSLQPMTLNDLSLVTKASVSILSSKITLLLLQGSIKEIGGIYHAC